MTVNEEPSFTIGIEEEYLLIDPETRDLAVDPPVSILEQCTRRVGERVTPEFLRSQIEVGTKVCRSITEVSEDLRTLRRCVARGVARELDLVSLMVTLETRPGWSRTMGSTATSRTAAATATTPNRLGTRRSPTIPLAVRSPAWTAWATASWSRRWAMGSPRR